MISVVMATYNDARYIGQTIESILNQTYRDFEFIIVNDGSRDNTLDIVQRYAAMDDRIVVIDKENGERARARNAGIARARYNWIAAMDADDIALPNRLERQLSYARQHPEVVVWGCYLYQIDGEDRILSSIRTGPTSVEAFYQHDIGRQHITIYNSCAMFRKDIALQVGGYDNDLVSVEDSALWNRMAEYGPIVVVPEVLMKYRFHGGNNSTRQFFRQKMLAGYISARYRSARQGVELTVADYIRQYEKISPLRHFNRDMLLYSQFYYRRASVALHDKKYSDTARLMLLSLLAHPIWAAQRILYRATHRKDGTHHWEGV